MMKSIEKNNKLLITTNLKKAYKNRQSVFIWGILNNHKVSFSAKITKMIEADEEFLITVEKNKDIETSSNFIKKKKNINILISDQAVIFKSIIYGTDILEQFLIKFPSSYFQIDRRKMPRLKITSQRVFIKIEQPSKSLVDNGLKIKKNIYDLSTGGLAFYASEQEVSNFRKGQRISDIILRFSEYEYKFVGVVHNIIKVEPSPTNDLMYPSNKVSFKFIKLSQKKINDLKCFIFDELLKAEARKKKKAA
jgi:c-di-GMP-binding flagellar brake protein YcgR